jgi:hypothetical protein
MVLSHWIGPSSCTAVKSHNHIEQDRASEHQRVMSTAWQRCVCWHDVKTNQENIEHMMCRYDKIWRKERNIWNWEMKWDKFCENKHNLKSSVGKFSWIPNTCWLLIKATWISHWLQVFWFKLYQLEVVHNLTNQFEWVIHTLVKI